ncbi:MAG: HIT family protein [Saprospiraceae bacterium]
MPTIFTRIINGELPSYKIAETEDFIAFLDIRPMRPGHTLCVPKKEVDYIFDLEPQLHAGLMEFARRIALAIEPEVECSRIAVAVLGLEVPHAHVHLVPIRTEKDMRFGRSIEIEPAEMERLAEAIAARVVLD